MRFFIPLLISAPLIASIDISANLNSVAKNSIIVDSSKRYNLYNIDSSIDFGVKFKIADNPKLSIYNLNWQYYPNKNSLISIGRVNLDLDLLQGSFDGVYGAYIKDNLNLRGFYFKHYTILNDEIYKNLNLKSLYGFSFDYSGKNIYISNTTYKNIALYSTSSLGFKLKNFELYYTSMLYKNGGYKEYANIYNFKANIEDFNYNIYYAQNGTNPINRVFSFGVLNSITPAIYYSLNSANSKVALFGIDFFKDNLFFSTFLGVKDTNFSKNLVGELDIGYNINNIDISCSGYFGDQKRIGLNFIYRIK